MPNKTQYHLATIAFRWFAAAVLVFSVFAPIAPAQPVRQPAAAPAAASLPVELIAIDGVYHGTYTSDKGPIKLTLTLTTQQDKTLAGVFTLYLPEGSATTAYTCRMDGRYIPGRAFGLARPKWETAEPKNLNILVMNGTFDAGGGQGAGKILGKSLPSQSDYELTRDTAESAKMPTVLAAKQAAKAFTPAVINGVYTGEYRRNGGWGKLKFSIKSTDDGSLTGLFTFEPSGKPGSFITYKLTGKYDAAAALGPGSTPFQFTAMEPVGSAAQDALNASKEKAVHVAIGGPDSINGTVTGASPGGGEFNCGGFDARKDRTASADLDKVMTAQASAASVATAAAAVVRSSFDGVYNGTYTNKQGTTKFKLTLWTKQENRGAGGARVNSNVAGVLAFYLPEGSGTNAYTCDLKGFYVPAHDTQPDQIQLSRTNWETRPPGDLLYEAGMLGVFDPKGGNGAGQFSGTMSDGSNSKFQALRDAAESAKLARAQLSDKSQPSIEGVFNGTYTRGNGLPTKFKLTMTYPPHGGGAGGSADLVGVATIYLPTDSGTKAYTYSLTGAGTGYGEFAIKVSDWETIPPRDFKDFKAMGFDGRFVPDMTQNTARIISVSAPDPSLYLPKFEATWDATASADIKGAIAAQKAVGDADLAVALKAHAEVMKSAPPKQLASTDLVRKSRKYWGGYQTDMIREVFDGGFGAAIEENRQFEAFFCTYVETFSAKCPDCLPANHQTVTVTQKTNRQVDASGNVIREDVRTFTIEMDPRFVDTYQRFSKALSSPGAGMRGAAAGMQSGGAQHVLNDLLAVASDMQKFFADHGGKSAAMRQMNENFLRAITGAPSVQQAGGKIDGAEAESDRNLPPGRYARFVDAANAYFRERATRNPIRFGNSSSHDTAFCQRLAELCQADMTPEEEYYYANDFEGRFLQITGSRAMYPDPAWPRLHPDVEQAIAEVK